MFVVKSVELEVEVVLGEFKLRVRESTNNEDESFGDGGVGPKINRSLRDDGDIGR